jgi:uncharacterized protein (TIGR02271 family)
MAKRSQHTETFLADAALGQQVQQIRIPLVEETVQVSKRIVDTGKGVRVHKTVSEHAQVVDLSLLQDELLIEHIAVDTLMTGEILPVMRYEGETMIVPVFEEVLLVQKQVRLKEEIRITRRRRERHAPQTILLKTETATVERFEETPTAAPTTSSKGE